LHKFHFFGVFGAAPPSKKTSWTVKFFETSSFKQEKITLAPNENPISDIVFWLKSGEFIIVSANSLPVASAFFIFA
jgi:hypothetical protein